MSDRSWEELRAAYMARVLKVEYGRVLSAVRAWNRMSDAAKTALASSDPGRRRQFKETESLLSNTFGSAK